MALALPATPTAAVTSIALLTVPAAEDGATQTLQLKAAAVARAVIGGKQAAAGAALTKAKALWDGCYKLFGYKADAMGVDFLTFTGEQLTLASPNLAAVLGDASALTSTLQVGQALVGGAFGGAQKASADRVGQSLVGASYAAAKAADGASEGSAGRALADPASVAAVYGDALRASKPSLLTAVPAGAFGKGGWGKAAAAAASAAVAAPPAPAKRRSLLFRGRETTPEEAAAAAVSPVADPEIPAQVEALVRAASRAMAEANAKVQEVVLRAKVAAVGAGGSVASDGSAATADGAAAPFDTVAALRYIAKVAAVAQGELAERVALIAAGIERGVPPAETDAALQSLGDDFTGAALDARVGATPVSEAAVARELADMGRAISPRQAGAGIGKKVPYATVGIVAGAAVGCGLLLGLAVAGLVAVARRKRRAAATTASAVAGASSAPSASASATVAVAAPAGRYASKMGGNPKAAAPSPAQLNN
jgi:hypothetical protein